jgi:hypothetical protein
LASLSLKESFRYVASRAIFGSAARLKCLRVAPVGRPAEVTVASGLPPPGVTVCASGGGSVPHRPAGLRSCHELNSGPGRSGMRLWRGFRASPAATAANMRTARPATGAYACLAGGAGGGSPRVER